MAGPDGVNDALCGNADARRGGERNASVPAAKALSLSSDKDAAVDCTDARGGDKNASMAGVMALRPPSDDDAVVGGCADTRMAREAPPNAPDAADVTTSATVRVAFPPPSDDDVVVVGSVEANADELLG